MGFWNFITRRGRADGAAVRGRAVCGTDSRAGRRETGPVFRTGAACVLAAALALTLAAGTAEAQSATTFVKNTGQTAVSGALIIGHSGASRWETGAAFTTGSNSGGYTLSEVVVRVGGSASGASPKVSIYTTNSSGLPASSLHVLNNPASLTVNALNTFTAGSGATLAPNTTYAVVLQQTGTSGSWNVLRTASGDEDSGAASGWSIADQRAWRNAASTTTWSTTNEAVMIEIKGTLGGHTGSPSTPAVPDTTPPRLTRAAVSGDTLRLTFSEGLDGSSVPAAAAFDVSVDGASGAPAAVRVSGRTVTLTLTEEVEPGAAVTVGYDPSRAGGNPLRDAAGNDVLAFSGRPVSHGAPEEVKRIFKRTLAAVAARTVSGALDNIGARLGGAAPASSLTLAGGPAVRRGRTPRSGAAGFDGHGPDDAWPSGGGHGRGMAAGGLLGSSAFSLTLGAAPGDKEGGKEGGERFDPKATRWGIWGRGDYGTFAGRPGEGSRYTGAARTAWFGADARGASGRWAAGLAVSSGTSETDYTLEDETGRLETDLTALWPYGRWTFGNGLELRGLAGAGGGWVRYFPEGDAPVERSRLTMRAAALGVRRALRPLGGFGHGIDLAARADANLARMHTAKGDEEEEKAVDGLRADIWRLSGGVEASRRFEPRDGVAVTPFTELAARRDGGDGPAGTGLELAGGVRLAAPGVSVEARGRWLAAHSAKTARGGARA